jgi:hypothetical protein
MSTFQRFAFGGLGGLLPVIVRLTAFHLVASVIDNWYFVKSRQQNRITLYL